jgi:hypothetical protein
MRNASVSVTFITNAEADGTGVVGGPGADAVGITEPTPAVGLEVGMSVLAGGAGAAQPTNTNTTSSLRSVGQRVTAKRLNSRRMYP